MYNRYWDMGRKCSNEKGNEGGGRKERRDKKKSEIEGENGNKAWRVLRGEGNGRKKRQDVSWRGANSL